jgi:arylsulfatase
MRASASTDAEIGRLFDAVKDTGAFDNTLIFYIIGDNAERRGGMVGMFNEMTYFNGLQSRRGHREALRRAGSSSAYPHMAAGWAVAGGTPFVRTKQVASTQRHPQQHHRLVAQGISAHDEVRSQ